jgi:hypothetical protein
VRLRLAVVAGVIGSLLAGCASTTPSRTAPPVVSERGPVVTERGSVLLCNLDSLFWSHRFVARADARDCVGILESVRLRN